MVPLLSHARRELGAGRVPLWNPYAGTGAPMLANQQSAVLHPFTLVACAAGATAGLTVLAALRFAMALGGAWLLAAHLGLRTSSSAFAGAAFALSGSIAAWICYPLGSVFAHAPLLILLARNAARGRNPSLLSLGLASSVMAGHFELLPVIWTVALGAGLWGRVGAARRIAGPFVLGALLGMVMILPGLEYLAQSPRLGHRERGLVRLFEDRRLLPAIVDPTLLLDPRTHDLASAGYNPSLVAGLALGSLVVSLAFLGAARRDGRGLALWTIVAAALLVKHPLSAALWSLPVLRLMGSGKLFVFPALFIAILAGRGAEAIADGVASRHAALAGLGATFLCIATEVLSFRGLSPLPAHAVAWTVAGALVPFGLAIAPRTSATIPLLAVTLLVDRALALRDVNPWGPAGAWTATSPVLETARDRVSHERVCAPGKVLFPDLATAIALRDVRLYDAVAVRGCDALARADGGTALGTRPVVPSAAGREAASRVLILPEGPWIDEEGAPRAAPDAARLDQDAPAREGRLIAVALHARTEGTAPVAVSVTREGDPSPAWRAELRAATAGWTEIPIPAFPRTRIGDRVRVTVERAAGSVVLSAAPRSSGPRLLAGGKATELVLAMKLSWDLDVAHHEIARGQGVVAVLDPAALPRARLEEAPQDPARVTYRADESTRVDLVARAAGTTRVVLADAFYPGWTVEVDGRTARLEGAAARGIPDVFRAVSILPGEHAVRFRYVPSSYRLGLFLSLLGAAIAAGSTTAGKL